HGLSPREIQDLLPKRVTCRVSKARQVEQPEYPFDRFREEDLPVEFAFCHLRFDETGSHYCYLDFWAELYHQGSHDAEEDIAMILPRVCIMEVKLTSPKVVDGRLDDLLAVVVVGNIRRNHQHIRRAQFLAAIGHLTQPSLSPSR
ncbi:hypothetical protein AKJ16_DCAP15084, partial [Drosera capensis]